MTTATPATPTWVCECHHGNETPQHAYAVRVFANGTKHWGMWCRRCGAWHSMARAAVPERGLDTYVDGVRDAWRRELSQRHTDQDNTEWSAWREWYDAVYLRTPHWRGLRAAVLERDPMCRGCGVRASENVHHLTYARLGCELLTDLVGYCRPCHERAHAHNRAMCPCNRCAYRRGQRCPTAFVVELGS